jgi:acetyl esterase/lipase
MAEKRNATGMAAPSQLPQGIKQTDLQCPTEDGSSVRAKLFQPVSRLERGGPLIVIYHGGDVCLGGPENEELACQNIVQAFGAVCIAPTYRLAPEFKFPLRLEGCLGCLEVGGC